MIARILLSLRYRWNISRALAKRRRARPARSAASVKGWSTKRAPFIAHALVMRGEMGL